MTIPSAATKQHLDSSSDDPRQARGELADLVDKFNTLRSHLSSSGITSGSSVLGIGTGLESAGGNLRLSDSGVSAGNYTAPTITVDAKGRVTAAESSVASQAEMEAETVGKLADSSLVRHSPGVAKGWVNFNGTGTIAIREDYGVDSLTDVTVGRHEINWTTAFTTDSYCVSANGTAGVSQSRTIYGVYRDNANPTTNYLSASKVQVGSVDTDDNAMEDRDYWFVQAWGDQ